MVAAIGAVVFVLLRVSRPIQTMTGAMTVLAGGDMSVEVPHRARRDESAPWRRLSRSSRTT